MSPCGEWTDESYVTHLGCGLIDLERTHILICCLYLCALAGPKNHFPTKPTLHLFGQGLCIRCTVSSANIDFSVQPPVRPLEEACQDFSDRMASRRYWEKVELVLDRVAFFYDTTSSGD